MHLRSLWLSVALLLVPSLGWADLAPKHRPSQPSSDCGCSLERSASHEAAVSLLLVGVAAWTLRRGRAASG